MTAASGPGCPPAGFEKTVVAPPEGVPVSPPVPPAATTVLPPANGLGGNLGLEVVTVPVVPPDGTNVTSGSTPVRGCGLQLHSTSSMPAPRKNQRVTFQVVRAALHAQATDRCRFKT